MYLKAILNIIDILGCEIHMLILSSAGCHRVSEHGRQRGVSHRAYIRGRPGALAVLPATATFRGARGPAAGCLREDTTEGSHSTGEDLH